jgi:hypothetical protein
LAGGIVNPVAVYGCIPLAILLFAVAGCSGDTSPSVPASAVVPRVIMLSVSLGAESIATGGTTVASASGRDQNGFRIGLGTVTWTIEPTDVAAITSAGIVTGKAPGTATITATSGGAVARAAITVAVPLPPGPSVSPSMAATAPGAALSFTARDDAGATQAVTWRVNGIDGGNADVGSISTGGRYMAPSKIPTDDSVIVTAVTVTDTTRRRSATVFFVPELSSRDYYVALPRVVDATRPAHTRFLVVPAAGVTSVAFLPSGSESIPLTSLGNGVFTLDLDGSRATSRYVTGTLHNVVGMLDYRDAGGAQTKLAILEVNVRDAAMPDVPVTSLATDAQRSPFVLNMRLDSVAIRASQSVSARALQLLGGDKADFLIVISTVSSNNNRSADVFRNDVRGIGATVFDNSLAWGGRGRLRTVVSFPLDDYFDGASSDVLTMLGYCWVNYASDGTLPRSANPQWPASTMALGLMGFTIRGPTSTEGGVFPWALTPVSDSTLRVTSAVPSGVFAPLDLYAMGLLSPDSVPTMYVLAPSVDPRTLADGVVVPGSAYSINTYIAAQGARVPSSATSQRSFAMATVILSYGRLLTPTEMAFFDAAASRAETTVPLREVQGLITDAAAGFFSATGGRGTLHSRLP